MVLEKLKQVPDPTYVHAGPLTDFVASLFTGAGMPEDEARLCAEVLVDARRLGLDIGAADILERYERWRRFDTALLLAVTDGLNRLFSNDIAPLKLVRDLGLAAVNRVAPLKKFFMRQAMGVVGDLPRLVRGEPL